MCAVLGFSAVLIMIKSEVILFSDHIESMSHPEKDVRQRPEYFGKFFLMNPITEKRISEWHWNSLDVSTGKNRLFS